MTLPKFLSRVANATVLTAISLAVASPSKAASSAPAHRPNVLVILTDEQFADALSCRQGDRYLRTPNMDSLAARGVSFTRAYVANPLCVPSRTAMLTGRYPHETGVQTNEAGQFDPAKFPTMGTYFQRAGYDTGYVGKWHLAIPAEDSAVSGFNYAANLIRNTQGGDAGTPPAVAEFLNRKRDRPFLLVASFLNPHNICEWARGQKLPDGDIGPPPPPENCPPAPVNRAPQNGEPEAVDFARRSYVSSPQFPVAGYDEAKWRQYRWAYYRMIELTDALLGQVLASLAASGHADDTLIVFTSDHGDCQGAHGWNQKQVLYEESLRVPFMVVPPHGTRPGTSDRLVHTGVDLVPTLLDYAGIAKPRALPGFSQRSPVEGANEPDPRRFVVVSNHLVQGVPLLGITMKPAGRGLIGVRYKYCVYDQGKNRESLVDLQNDPGETRNLAGEPASAEVLNQHRTMLMDWSREMHDTAFPYVAPGAGSGTKTPLTKS